MTQQQLEKDLWGAAREEKLRGGKDAKTGWMQKLERIRNENFHSYCVKVEEYGFLCELYEWLIEKKVEAELE